ncbi:methyltransferase domain-containing protein [Syntrophomonas curvata]
MSRHKEHFNQLAAGWEEMISDKTRECLRDIVHELNITPGAAVLDVGSGTGVLLPMLLDAVASGGKVVALDIAENMLEQARLRYQDTRLDFVVGDAVNPGLPRHSFDEIICNSCFPHFRDKAAALRQLAALLKPGGRLVICHTQSREAINHLHRSLGGLVAEDTLPDDSEMVWMISKAGLTDIKISDGEKYLLSCWKPLKNREDGSPETSNEYSIALNNGTGADAAHLSRLSRNLQEAIIIYQAFAAGIFERLGKQTKRADELAQEGEQDVERLVLFLDALAALGLLNKEGCCYRNSDFSLNYLWPDSPRYMGDLLALQLAPERRQAWDKLVYWLKGETIAPNRFERPTDAFNPSFIKAMAQSALNQKDLDTCVKIVSGHPCFNRCQQLLDLGGGHGLYAIALKQLNPHMKAQVFDFPHVEAVARSYAREYGVELDFIGGNFHHDKIPGHQDIVLAFDMLYPAGRQVYAILNKIYHALKPGGYLFTRHWLLDRTRTRPERAALFALQSRLGNPDAHVPTQEEMKSMLINLGFNIEAVHFVDGSASTMLVACK